MPCQFAGVRSQPVLQPQTPHQQHSAQDAMFFPTPRRNPHVVAQVKRTAVALQLLSERHIFHQWNQREFPGGFKQRARNKQALIAGGNPR